MLARMHIKVRCGHGRSRIWRETSSRTASRRGPTIVGAMKSLPLTLALLLSASSASALLGQGPGKTVATLKFVKDHSTPSTVKLPTGTRTVTFAARNGGLHCARIVLTLDDGGTSGFLLDSPIQDRTSMSSALDQQNPKSTYASVDVECQAEGATGQLIVSAR